MLPKYHKACSAVRICISKVFMQIFVHGANLLVSYASTYVGCLG